MMAVIAICGLALAAPAAALASGHPAEKPAAIGPGLGTAHPSVSAATVCAVVANKAGFGYKATVDGYPQIVVAVSVALAESSCNASAVNVNGPTSGCPNGSEDRGLWQINNCYHPNVSNACAFQIQCNANAAFTISDGGTNWTPWSTFNSGAWESYISLAKSVISGFTYTLKDQADGTCLDADGSDTGNGGPIWQWACNSSSNYQRWTVEDVYGQRFLLKNVATGTCLAGNGNAGSGGTVHQWKCNSAGAYQQWSVRGTGKLNTNGNADAIFVNNANGLCLDDTSASHANKTPVYQLTCAGGLWEQWN
jgi:hypothetical protein